MTGSEEVKAKNRYPEFDKPNICKFTNCESKIMTGDWMCDRHKEHEIIWKEKCQNCGHYH